MNRRSFLETAGAAGLITALGGGMWVKASCAREKLTSSLVTKAQPILTSKSEQEMESLPAAAREKVREWFHGKCLTVAPFVKEVCSLRFAERLRQCKTEEHQHQLLLVAFCGHVATEAEILTRVHTIAEETGQQLDHRWSVCCQEIERQWDLQVREQDYDIDFAAFEDRVEKHVQLRLRNAIVTARAGADRPALGETVTNIGESAIKLLSMTRVRVGAFTGIEANPVAIRYAVPTFVIQALGHFFRFALPWLRDPRPDMQSAFSGELALLGNQIGSEFESEVRMRIGVLHRWQQDALEASAREYAHESIGII